MANRVIKHEETISDYQFQMPVHNEMSNPNAIIVDKTKSISELSNRELRLLIDRLGSERRAEELIRDLKRSSGERDDYDNPVMVDTTTPINQLYHHGILGQKWGVRRFQNPDGTRTAKGKARENANREKPKTSEDHDQSRTDRKNATQGLSNAELRRLNDRLQLEKTYKELTAAENKRNESYAKGILKKIGEKTLVDAGSRLTTGLLNNLVVDPILKKNKNGG